MELKVSHTRIISELMDENEICLKDILQRIAHTKRTDKGYAVCQFHKDLKDYSVIFTAEWQAEVFGLSVNEIECRIKYYLNYWTHISNKMKLG